MDNGNLLILKEETLKVFRFYFLALLLICALPVFAQEAPASEGAQEQSEAAAPAQEAPAEAAQQDEAAAAEQPAEAAPAEEAAPAKDEAPAEEAPAPAEEKAQAEEGQSDLEAELAAQADDKAESEELAKAEEEKKNEKKTSLTVGLNNGFSHGFAKERKNFAYTLNIFASYALPLEFAVSLDVGLREVYRYGMNDADSNEDGSKSTTDLDYSKFDGTPLNIGLSKGFMIPGEVLISLGIGASIPFTSKELWDQYKIRTILGVDLGIAKNFKLPKEVTLGLSFGFSYAKTFAEDKYAWDDYSNEPLGANQNHDIGLSLAVGVGYKGFNFKVSGGYSIGSDYKFDDADKYLPDPDFPRNGTIKDSEWYYLFSFGATASYTIKGFVFALGVRTNAPEFDNGNYEGFTELPGDPEVKNGSTNYPFKAKYTTVFANIGYSYSF